MKHEIYVTITYHYERIPKILQGIVSKKYMNNHSAVVDIFNKYIGLANETFDKTGLPYLVNDQSDEFNPEYIKCIKKSYSQE